MNKNIYKLLCGIVLFLFFTFLTSLLYLALKIFRAKRMTRQLQRLSIREGQRSVSTATSLATQQHQLYLMTPPPTYEGFIDPPPSYEEVVGFHSMNHQHQQAIAHPISATMTRMQPCAPLSDSRFKDSPTKINIQNV